MSAGFNVVPVTLGDQSPRLGSTSPSSINPVAGSDAPRSNIDKK
jgi:hypothetical protein